MDIEHHYIEQGAGFPLILLHGNGEDLSYFEHQMEPFARHFRVIAVDTRGHGQTPRGEAPFTIRQFADDLLAFLEAMQAAANSGKNGLTVTGLSGADHFFPITDDERQGWRGMKLNEASWETLPPLITGWQWCALTFDRLQPRMICIKGNKYI